MSLNFREGEIFSLVERLKAHEDLNLARRIFDERDRKARIHLRGVNEKNYGHMSIWLLTYAHFGIRI